MQFEGCLMGFVQKAHKRVHFVYDYIDTPYNFSRQGLMQSDVYFKAQCPIRIDQTGFELAPEAVVPFHDFVLDYRQKIVPAMLGVRQLALASDYASLHEGYQNLLNSRVTNKDEERKSNKLLMAYFGSDFGVEPVEVDQAIPPQRVYGEAAILGYFGGRISHPNLKRSKAVRIIQTLGQNFDARLINTKDPITNEAVTHANLVVPLRDFSRHVAQFNYNLNISGFRMSIPNRFVDSFVVGTKVLTDKLSVKWYRPFEAEVQETVPMGYLPDKQVDWVGFERDLLELKPTSRSEIIRRFEEVWSPTAFAHYVVDTCLKKNI